MGNLISFKDYSMGFQERDGSVENMLDRISFDIEEGTALGVVGESGCGKSMTSLSIMGLLPDGAVVQGGSIEYLGQDLLQKTPAEMRAIRGKEIAMIFQEPMTSLNPVYTIGFQIGEMLKIHYPELSKEEVEKRVIAQLEAVGRINFPAVCVSA